MRTVSKMGLAGLRLGVLAGAEAWLEEIDKVRLPYNINVLTQASAEFALEHKPVLDGQAKAIREERERMFARMGRIEGIRVYPSQANFLLFRTEHGRADGVFHSVLEAGVLIKNLSGAGGVLGDCLRVTVGRGDENDAFLQALEDALRVK
jgi:histidinol-phosphate aminotransferase